MTAASPGVQWWPASALTFALPAPQRWLNLRGTVSHTQHVAQAQWRIDDGPWQPLSLGPDGHRLARPGDFNIEIDPADLQLAIGAHQAIVRMFDAGGQHHQSQRTFTLIQRDPPRLPIVINPAAPSPTDPMVHITDGCWSQQPDGLRIDQPYYDRALAFGNPEWTDYAVRAKLTLHGYMQPTENDAGNSVIHVAIALRWPGHDVDEHQPHRKWYPLGVTFELCVVQSKAGPTRLRLRALGGSSLVAHANRDLLYTPGQTLCFHARVQSTANRGATYCARAWPVDATEPTDWDVILDKPHEPITRGGVLALCHYTQATWHEWVCQPV